MEDLKKRKGLIMLLCVPVQYTFECATWNEPGGDEVRNGHWSQ